MRRRPSAGFSFHELLATIVILSVLYLFFLHPFVQSSRAHARQMTCLSNLKQFGTSLAAYARDYDGWFPAAARLGPQRDAVWADVAAPYAKTSPASMACTEVRAKLQKVNAGGREHALLPPGQGVGYAYNAYYDDALRASGKNAPVLRHPEWTILLGEARPGILSLYGPDDPDGVETQQGLVNVRSLSITASFPAGATRHDQGANYAFADGHAKWLKPGSLLPGPKSDGKAPGFGL